MHETPDSPPGIEQIADLIEQIEAIADPHVRARVEALIQALLEFHGAGVERILELTAESDAPGLALIDRFAADQHVASLLLLYGLHPLDLEARVRQALTRLGPALAAQGGYIELIGITDEAVAQLRLQVSDHSRAASALTLRQTIAAALEAAAPDLGGLEIAELARPIPSSVGLIPLELGAMRR